MTRVGNQSAPGNAMEYSSGEEKATDLKNSSKRRTHETTTPRNMLVDRGWIGLGLNKAHGEMVARRVRANELASH